MDERSKEIESSSTTDAEAIEMIELTSKDINTTVKDVEQDMSFIEPGERDKLLPLRELEGLDKQLRTIKGSLKVPIEIVKCGFWHKLPLFYHFCGMPMQQMKISVFPIYPFTNELLPSSLYNLVFMKGPNCMP